MGFLTPAKITELAKRSIEAEKAGQSIEPITNFYPELTLREGYTIQKCRQEIMEREGFQVIGGKMGLTSIAKMKQMGATESIYGKLFDYMLLPPDGDLNASELIHPRVESEIAFVMKKDLYGPNVTSADVMTATDYIVPAFEIIDSRYHGFQFKNPDSVADNLSAARFKLGAVHTAPDKIDLAMVGVTISFNGEDTIFASGGAVLGHPARAIAMYANLLARMGEGLLAGQVVLSGAITAATPVSAGDCVRAEFGGMGTIEMSIK